MKIFDLDGPIIQFLNKMADIMWLNILTVICCIPIFTVGAAFTSMHYVALKIVRNEEGYITKDFFKAFKQNFVQSTIIWIIMAAVAGLLAGDYYIVKKMDVEINNIVQTALWTIGLFTAFTAIMVFPVQAKFSNTVGGTIRNAFIIGAVQFPKTILMIIMLFFPVIVYLISWRALPVAFLFGFSLPAYLSAMLYNKTFMKLEDKYRESTAPEETAVNDEDDERIFKDELVETIASNEKI
jgi:uncharacterized membrane protein YesL